MPVPHAPRSDAEPRTVFVAGATGVVGRPLAARLVAAGHRVRALVRDRARAAAVLPGDVELVAGDVLDPAVGALVVPADVVVHAATPIPSPGAGAETWAHTERLRRSGTDHLLRGAERAGASFLLASATAIYGDGGDDWVSAAEPVIDPAPALESMLEAEEAVFGSGVRFLILRQGVLFGAGTGAAATLLEAVARASFPIVPERPAWQALLHPEDFAAFALGAVERGLGGVYDAVSDVPRVADLVVAAAEELGAPPPPPLDAAAAAERLGPEALGLWYTSRRVSAEALAAIGVPAVWSWPRMLAEAVAAARARA